MKNVTMTYAPKSYSFTIKAGPYTRRVTFKSLQQSRRFYSQALMQAKVSGYKLTLTNFPQLWGSESEKLAA